MLWMEDGGGDCRLRIGYVRRGTWEREREMF